MSIFLFDEAFRDMVVPYRTLRNGLVTLTGGSGSIPLRIVFEVHRTVHQFTVAADALDTEFEMDGPGYVNANSFLSRRPGAPQTVALYRSAIAAIEAARPAMEDATLLALNAGANTWVKTSHTTGSVTTADFETASALPAGVGNAWRSHADVIAYRDALIAAGG